MKPKIDALHFQKHKFGENYVLEGMCAYICSQTTVLPIFEQGT